MRRSRAIAFAVGLAWLGSCSDGGPSCDDPTGLACTPSVQGVILSDPAPGDMASLAQQRAPRGPAFSFAVQVTPGGAPVPPLASG